MASRERRCLAQLSRNTFSALSYCGRPSGEIGAVGRCRWSGDPWGFRRRHGRGGHLHRGGRVSKVPARLGQSAQGKPAAFLSEIPQECRDLSGARRRKKNPNPLALPEDRSCQVCCPGQPASHRYAPRSLLVFTQPPLSSVIVSLSL